MRFLDADDSDAAAGQSRLILEDEIVLADESRGPVPVTAPLSRPSSSPDRSRERAFQNQLDAPPCAECGSIMVRSGSCFRCYNCGATSGCS